MFDSKIFAFFRYALSAINIITACIAFQAFISDVIRWKKSDPFSTSQALVWLMIGLFLETIGCVIRAVYYLGGPFYGGSEFWSVKVHSFMINITSPITIATIMIALIVFKLWTSIHHNPIALRIKLLFLGVFVLLVLLELLAGDARSRMKNGVAYSVTSGVVYLVVVSVSSVVFVLRGSKFYRSLSSMMETESKKIVLRKAVRWLIVSGVVQIGLFVATILLVTSVAFTPWGFFALMVLLGSSESLLALTQTLTFRPRVRVGEKTFLRFTASSMSAKLFGRSSNESDQGKQKPNKGNEVRYASRETELTTPRKNGTVKKENSLI
eukprot:c6606_g1_i2.p1 GENE.c6606_g1_i2~~c6606_g1_i2.p1  ORF type:complete len:361 (-),score=54.31 c6606_g1_i2:99-1070(-)